MIHTILYVEDQEISCNFYRNIFEMKPVLHVPGMTEFLFAENFKLGLMPNSSIVKILGKELPDPAKGTGIPRCEIYLYVDNLDKKFEHALKCKAKLASPLLDRNWGDRACYLADPDGHILAFAEKIKSTE